jgi:hypothetical protein
MSVPYFIHSIQPLVGDSLMTTQTHIPSNNRVINWAQRDMLSLRSSGYRGDLAKLIIDKKPLNSQKN